MVVTSSTSRPVFSSPFEIAASHVRCKNRGRVYLRQCAGMGQGIGYVSEKIGSRYRQIDALLTPCSGNPFPSRGETKAQTRLLLAIFSSSLADLFPMLDRCDQE